MWGLSGVLRDELVCGDADRGAGLASLGLHGGGEVDLHEVNSERLGSTDSRQVVVRATAPKDDAERLLAHVQPAPEAPDRVEHLRDPSDDLAPRSNR
jgi:hypothetical protein